MTTSTDFTAMDVALKDLALHELNARAQAPETYEAEDLDALAASIAALGLLNPLIVQKSGKVWGVLAGGRRLAALRALVNDRSAKGWTMRTTVPCRAVPDDMAAATAITVAENVTQKAMEPIDEYEAFARMMEIGGHDPDGIARLFGIERRRVIERLRYGRVHPDIRAAVRRREIPIDTMKAFAEHPDHEVQRSVFEALRASGGHISSYTVRGQLRDRGVRTGDPIGQLVIDAYRAAEGPVAADLIEEDSLLTDNVLVERLLVEALEAKAEEERARVGFAWSGAMRSYDWQALQTYGRVYPGEIEPEGDAAERCRVIAGRLVELDEARESEDCPNIDALEDEYERLNEEYDALTSGWSPDDLARSGVIAVWEQGEIRTYAGLVKPEDREASAAGASPSGTGASGERASAGGTASEEAGQPVVLSESLEADLRTEQAIVIGSALAADPDLAHDLLLFKVVADIMGRFGRVSYALGVIASSAERPHAKPDGMDERPQDALAKLTEALDLSWWDESRPKAWPHRFEAFRALDPKMKSRIVAVALAQAVKPTGLGYGEELLAHVAAELVPDIRAVWRPTGEAFFGRLKKSVLLNILATDLRQPEEAARLATAKKAEVVDYLDRLFAAPFATLTPEQREAVERWCPPGMSLTSAKEDAAEVENLDEPDDVPTDGAEDPAEGEVPETDISEAQVGEAAAA
ncbi:ParB/RepB/Spo0J family partition protein [Roseitranquillus sediminis]|uniref:ParB/RepB/Spo0J family partition protein n=1 Tax=Roseitranquillus sediminis TaxID=2809051 RepID=UPI001D0C5671|nr:ParB/RepB/Spo0J family partition protein [Roseitranquillus sediminis]MBM9595093.1 ParB/RepB/Spo0J family partition protein [Roseitranquillus sediminis]